VLFHIRDGDRLGPGARGGLPFLAVLAWSWWRERRFPFTTALVGFGVGGAYLLFRVWYYADLFPNTGV